MKTPATELQKLLELRDRDEITAEEFAVLKERVLKPLSPASPVRPARTGRVNLLGIPAWILAMGGLIGGTALLAMTEAGVLALSAIIILGFLLIFAWSMSDLW